MSGSHPAHTHRPHRATPRQLVAHGTVGIGAPAGLGAAIWWMTDSTVEPLRAGSRMVTLALCCAVAACTAAHVCVTLTERLSAAWARTRANARPARHR